MAVSRVGTLQTLLDDSDGATSTLSYTVPAGADLVCLFCSTRADTVDFTVADDVDGAWDGELLDVVSPGGDLQLQRRVVVWYLVNPTAGARTITITRGGSGTLRGCFTADSFDGVDTADPFGTVFSSNADSNAPSQDVTDAVSGDLIVDIDSMRGTGTATVGADQDEHVNTLIAGGVNLRHLYSSQDPDDDTVMSWSWTTSDNNAYAAFAIKAAAVGGGGMPIPVAYNHLRRMKVA